jgi:hypothetical protein
MSTIQWQTEPDRLSFHGTHYAEIVWNGSRTAKIGVMRLDRTSLLESDELFSSAEEMTLAVPRLKTQAEEVIRRDLASSPSAS